MVRSSSEFFNPSSLDENEQIPAKIWELLRRNDDFRALVQQVGNLDSRARKDSEKTGKYHGAAWHQSCRLVRRVAAHHPFAGIALQWLVPEPLFHCRVAAWPLGRKWKNRAVVAVRFLRVGHGTAPDVNDQNWSWKNRSERSIQGYPMVRGPEVHWTTSRFKWLRDQVNPILEWKKYPWPFTVDHAWPAAPGEFRRQFQFVWRSCFDSRPLNPITNARSDSPAPHEISFFRDWKLTGFRDSGHLTQADLYQILRFKTLAKDYRAFAIPKTVLTKGSAQSMGDWLADELKKGSDLHGDLLKGELLDESELLGLRTEWHDWLGRAAGQTVGAHKDVHFYRRCRYMDSLVALVFPDFNLAKLLAKPKHRSHGKKYERKIRSE